MFIDLSEFPNGQKYSIAILVAKTRHGNNHTGILTCLDDKIDFYHLAWHLNLERNSLAELIGNEELNTKKWIRFVSLTADPIVADFRIPAIIKFLEIIFERNRGRIPYSLKFRDTKFTTEGELNLGEGECGLTCATFVASFFNSVAINLVDLDSWPAREPEDSAWKAFTISMMIKTHVEIDHVANVSMEVINFRLKPEEIAVSSFQDEEDLPANFTFCSVEGARFNTL